MTITITTFSPCPFQPIEGIIAEKYFEILCQNKSIPVTPATVKENRNEKWDYSVVIDSIDWNVDVKCMKRIKRSDPNSQDKFVWIELDRVCENNPPIGWLYAKKSNMVAFECRDEFILIEKSKLQTLVNKKLNHVAKVTPTVNYIYKRKRAGKKYDTLTLLHASDIRSAAFDIWPKTPLMAPTMQDECKHITSSQSKHHLDALENITFKSNRLKRKREEEIAGSIIQYKFCPSCGIRFC